LLSDVLGLPDRLLGVGTFEGVAVEVGLVEGIVGVGGEWEVGWCGRGEVCTAAAAASELTLPTARYAMTWAKAV
jgi:hypothetical protein